MHKSYERLRATIPKVHHNYYGRDVLHTVSPRQWSNLWKRQQYVPNNNINHTSTPSKAKIQLDVLINPKGYVDKHNKVAFRFRLAFFSIHVVTRTQRLRSRHSYAHIASISPICSCTTPTFALQSACVMIRRRSPTSKNKGYEDMHLASTGYYSHSLYMILQTVS